MDRLGDKERLSIPLPPRQSSPNGVESLEVIERPPSDILERRISTTPNPLSIHVLALLIPASIFGTLARLGLDALAKYDGNSIFPLAYAQATGCLIMGFALGLKEPLSNLCANPPILISSSHAINPSYPPLYTAITTGNCSIDYQCSNLTPCQVFVAR